ncbi:DUF1254 domain-containing protein [Nocardia bhagyanarayanae]|uniref:DUF1254 domain-containing protein n=1 Tax=Nocardia bhagyanarayanae TaxID=1215925 RepID=A0A543FIF4_9NOCA|nr:DUF1254 domain-containing protein [Nocardia bhagyanarayanae]TQM33621.1 hypothetical protein FB390_5357 [Nocardia bhagyanarayanae]
MTKNFGVVDRRSLFGIGAALAASVAVSACDSDEKSSTNTATSGTSPSNDPTAVAADAYVFGYPLVLMDATRAAAGPANVFVHADQLPTPADRTVVRMNLDTLYSQAWLDLRAEPLVLQVPEMEPDRYWLMQMLDAWTNTVHNPSSARPKVRSGQQTPPFTYLLTGPGWSGEVPPDMTQLAMPTNTVWVIGRVQVDGDADIAAVRAIQQKMKLAPLSAWQADSDRATPGVTAEVGQPSANPSKQVADMDGPTFFAKFSALMMVDPPAPDDQPAMLRFATLGITPGGTPTADAAVLDAGAQSAKEQIADYQDPQIRAANGWKYSTDLGAYGTNYPLRAKTARFALGANLPEDALYPSLTGTADANGAAQRFRLHFAADQFPPVDAFWSITAYDADSFLIPNPANIYAVGHQIPITKNADGSADIAVQNADPGGSVPVGNWLPIPASGKFSLSMRLYAPKPEAAEGKWEPPALENVT